MNSAERLGIHSEPRYAGFRVLLRLIYRTVFHSKGTAARFTLKRVLLLIFFVPFFLAMQAINRAALLLDDVFFRGYRDVEVKEPVFVVGVHRSGTTYLHHLLSRDTDNFTTFNLWELFFAPAIIERKFWFAAGAADRALGGFGRRLLFALEDRALKDLRAIHHTALFEPEEDELVLLPYFASVFLLLPFPFPEMLWALIRFDDNVPLREQDRIMARYKACVQRHLYVYGPRRRFISKNPSFSARIEAINRTFPDAKIVCNVRRPYETLPSLLSLMSFHWKTFDNDPLGLQLRDMILDMANYFYRHPIDRLPHWPKDRHAFLRYDDLTAHPERAVLQLYERFGIPFFPAFRACLKAQEDAMRSFKSSHRYSLDPWELTREHIRAEYRDVFEYFDFSTDHVA